jgi:hypothetical protein
MDKCYSTTLEAYRSSNLPEKQLQVQLHRTRNIFVNSCISAPAGQYRGRRHRAKPASLKSSMTTRPYQLLLKVKAKVTRPIAHYRRGVIPPGTMR